LGFDALKVIARPKLSRRVNPENHRDDPRVERVCHTRFPMSEDSTHAPALTWFDLKRILPETTNGPFPESIEASVTGGPESSIADLDELAQRIKEEHSNVASALQQGFMHAGAAGDLLIQAKGKVGHGKWLPWLRDECKISMRTASLYMRLAKNRGGIESQIGNAVADLTLRGAMKLLSPARQSDPHAEEMAEGGVGTVAAPTVDPMAIKDERKLLKRKGRPGALNADGPSIPSGGSPSPAEPAPSNSAEPPALRGTDGDGNYEVFKSRWVRYCEGDFAALPAAMQMRFLTEVLSMSVPTSRPASPPSPPFSVQLAAMLRG
jgi:hypothetical protein